MSRKRLTSVADTIRLSPDGTPLRDTVIRYDNATKRALHGERERTTDRQPGGVIVDKTDQG